MNMKNVYLPKVLWIADKFCIFARLKQLQNYYR